MDKIAQALNRLFEKHRIIFWYDGKSEFHEEFESLILPAVESIEISNNEYAVKYVILREKPNQKFLLYHKGPQPEPLDNWLLDVQLAYGIFSADQEALWLSDVGFPATPDFADLVQDHIKFFKEETHRLALKARWVPDDSFTVIRTKMLAVCVNAHIEERLESVLELLLAELAEGRRDKFDLIQRCNLDAFLWERLQVHFGYKSQAPSIRDFAITLFKACYAQSLEEPSQLTQDALIFLKRWRDSVRYQAAFEKLSDEYADILGIKSDLENRDFRKLADVDLFKLIDVKMLDSLAKQIFTRTISAGDCANIIWRRRNTHWYKEFSDIYDALYFGSQFIHELDNADLRMESLSDGIQKYQSTWYRIDHFYRKFIFHVHASRQNNLLARLTGLVENLYSNNFLLTVNDYFQNFIDMAETWSATQIPSQSEFFERYVNDAKNKVAVIISDALRYEIAYELMELIGKEEGYTAEIEPMVASLPSYTQLGMAALLPHQTLKILKDGNVQVNGQSTLGLESRSKILSEAVEKGALALRADDLRSMGRDRYREVTKGCQVVYVYHNQIDNMGDDKISEGRVFDIVPSVFVEIFDLLKKLYDSYFANILITSDHGFIYQNQPLDESEFAAEDVAGAEIFYRNRRFVIGKGLSPNKSMKIFTASELGLSGDYEVALPKSINRLRVQGAGSRYVHGGAALQEIVIPLIKVNRKRANDTTMVDVEIVASSSSIITSGQLSVAFFQVQPVSGKVLPRQLRAGLYSQDGTPLSDIHTLTFDLTSENPREREVRKQFVLSRKADEVNNQTVYLKLEEPVSDTTHFKLYGDPIPYQLRRSFTTDFDL